MPRFSCDFRWLLLVAAVAFIYIQMRLFATQSKYADRLAAAVPVAAVVVMACNRADYLERTVNSILKLKCLYMLTRALSFQISWFCCIKVPTFYIPGHYKWALDKLFYKHNFSKVIILEDDMEIAPDFFEYFEAAAGLLDRDRSIMAVSSWNDNGQKQFVHDPYVLYRSDFFPGLGWMLSKDTWDELSPKWPKAYPSHFFSFHLVYVLGSSLGQFFSQYLEPIKLNDVDVKWKSMDLSYLMEDNYIEYFASLVKKAKPIYGADAVVKANGVDGDVRIKYEDQPEFESIARQFGIFEEWKDGVPRAAYKGVVVFRYQSSKRVFLVGPDSLKQLGIETS
uniref:Alpha-1,3-mannosyl-glycoprotein 2-beta-N-acetylglucosaminyltransferase n=1 Tax=Chenopodium quinoa TaxID=63459 RepID=A0A803LGS7_CHEQI